MSASCDLATHVRHQRVRHAPACRPLGSRPKLVSQKGNATWLSLREVMVAEDVLLQSTFPVLPAGASSGPPPFDWWPTQTSRKGDGDPLGPHVIERGGIQSNSRGRSLADEALHREAVEKHLFESEKTSVRRDQSELNQSITTSFLPAKTNLSHDSQRRSRSIGIFVSPRQEKTTSNYSKEKTTAFPRSCRHVHPCCCLRFRKPATATSLCTPMLSHGHENLLIDCGEDLLSNDLLPSSSALLF